MRDDSIIHFQQQLHAVSFVFQLPLGGLSALGMQRVVHGNRDLVCYLLHKMDLCLLIGPPLQAAKSHRAEATLRRRERNHTE